MKTELYEENKHKLDMEINQRKILEELLATLKKSENESKMKIEENSYAGLLNNPEFLSKAENVLMNTFGEVDFETNFEAHFKVVFELVLEFILK